ncbi:proline-rich protein 18 [Denticeps clupeoides]|uniref:proline-rich protein 18 n=1 Tax=Denticeps clupeoides TaxID=299321 RepID=UPI0010A5137B|nr:proline-rich protein 18-like [Denticeps clupeoides]
MPVLGNLDNHDDRVHASHFLPLFSSLGHFLSYLLLFSMKMPFPPARSLSIRKPETSPMDIEVEQMSLKETLKKLGHKPSRLPTRRGGGAQSSWITSTRPVELQTSSSSGSSMGTGPQRGTGPFSLTFTPEAFLLLQRRNLHKQRCPAHQAGSAQPALRSSIPVSRRDPGALLRVSLLNERHKYDDVEYEDEDQGRGVDEGVVNKCREWLRGVESAGGPAAHVQKIA